MFGGSCAFGARNGFWGRIRLFTIAEVSERHLGTRLALRREESISKARFRFAHHFLTTVIPCYIDPMSTRGLTHPSIADIAEDQLVERLFADPLWGTELFELAGMPRGLRYKLCVPLDTAPGNPKGDIDVLRCAPDHPEQVVAYQLKRIKFGVDQLRNGTPTKLREFIKVARQANLVARMGFWQVYAYVVVVVDAREQNAGKGTTYEGLSSKLKSLVYSSVSPQPLDERVGLALLDFTQPMDYTSFRVGTHGLHLMRLSTPMTQSRELTDWVSNVFAQTE
jgi:hypothetical protein